MVNNKINGGGYFDWLYKTQEVKENNELSSNQVKEKPFFSWPSWGANQTDKSDKEVPQTKLGGKRKTKKAKKAKKSKTSKSKK
jgi:hypothetical protein